jgi:murein tripeptide amidase MpaA
MLNPDGVTLGNYRTGISGRDFNREYRNPDKSIFPEVYAFKKFVIDNKSLYRENLLMFLDFHGHSTKKNVFVYGPEFPII